MTVDPRLCNDARPVNRMTFGEVRELAFHGAGILHGACVDHAEDNGSHTLTVAHVSDDCWENNGTILTNDAIRMGTTSIVAMAVLESRVGISVCAKRGVVGFASQIFQSVYEAGVSVEMFSQTCSEQSICLLVPACAETKVVGALQKHNAVRSEHLCIITVVGELMRDTPGVAAEVCSALADHGVNIRCITQGATEMSLSVAVAQSDLHIAVNAVHDCLL
jgi:aspartate kinase